MKELWLEILEWIQLAITLAFLLLIVGVMGLVVKNKNLEFNGLWKTRAMMLWLAFLWGISLLLGRHQLWAHDGDGGDGGSGSSTHASHAGVLTSEGTVRGLCRAHVFLTYSIAQPLLFLIIIVILREKERTKLQLYTYDPNLHVLRRVLPWAAPLLVFHIVILGLSGVHEGAEVVWTTYSPEHRHCVVPLLSTAPFAVFYSCFLFFYWGTSRRLFTRMINRTMRMRVWRTQLFFVVVFPLEIILRFISIFISKYHDAFESVYHTYYFLQLIVCTVAIIEIVFLPELDATISPLRSGVTAAACQEYHKSEEEKKQRRYTRTHAALQRVMSEDEMEKGQNKNNNNNNINFNNASSSSSSSSSSPNKGNNTAIEPLQKKIVSSPTTPTTPTTTTTTTPTATKMTLSPSADTAASNKPLLSPTPIPSSSNDSIDDDIVEHDQPPTITTLSNLANLTLTTNPGGYPADLDVDDVFANIDDLAPGDDSSLKLKVDGIFLQDPELQ